MIDPTTTTLQGDLVVTGTVRSAAGGPKWSTSSTTTTTASQVSADLGSLTVDWTGTGRPTLALFKTGGVQVDYASSPNAQITFELIHRQRVRIKRPPAASHDPAGWTSLISVEDGAMRIASRGGQTWAISRSELIFRLVQGNWEPVGGPIVTGVFPFVEAFGALQGVDVSVAPDGTVFVLGGTGADDRSLMRWEGGMNWTTLPMAGRRVVARSRTEVYVVNSYSYLYLTTDGGHSQQHLGGGIRDLALTASGELLAQRVDGSTWNITKGTSTPNANSANPAIFTTADALGPIQLHEDGTMTWQDGGKTVRTEVFATHVAVDEQSRVFAMPPKGPGSLYTPPSATNPIEGNPIDVTHLDAAPVELANDVTAGRLTRDDIAAVDTIALADPASLATREALPIAEVSLRSVVSTTAAGLSTFTVNPRFTDEAIDRGILTGLNLPTDVLFDSRTTEDRDTVLAHTTLDVSANEYGQGSQEVQLLWMGALPPGAYTFLLQWRVAQPTTVARVSKYGDSQLLLVTEL